MNAQPGTPWISLIGDYLIADTASPEQLLNDSNLWLDHARTLLRLTLPLGDKDEPWSAASDLSQAMEGLDLLLQMAQGCVTAAHQRLVRRLVLLHEAGGPGLDL